ncbi:hypothetical protein ACFWNL_09290, partial [Kitasatospora sp. NPDC058397]|uniref:hypothetical protein n=1 Tax=Kitasatospora sp. NPDC058397 TaxID=3346478 RepID=UPI00366A4B82
MSGGDGRRDGLTDGWVRAGLLAAVVIGAFAEVGMPHRHYGWLVDAFALAAVGVVGAAGALGAGAAAPPPPPPGPPQPGPPPHPPAP